MQKSSFFRRAAAVIATGAAVIVAPLAASASAFDEFSKNVAATQTASQLGSSQPLPQLIGRFVQQAMGLLGIVLVVLVIYAGFLWMTAQGDADKVKRAKTIIQNAVIGLVLITASYAITTFVVAALTNATQ